MPYAVSISIVCGPDDRANEDCVTVSIDARATFCGSVHIRLDAIHERVAASAGLCLDVQEPL